MPAEPTPLLPSHPSGRSPHLPRSSPALPSRPSLRRPARTLHLGAAIDVPQPSVAETSPAQAQARAHVELALLAERGALDFVTLGGSGPPDAVALLTRVATATDRIGLLAAAPAAPDSGMAARVAALDRESRGRAGWVVTAAEAWEDLREPDGCPPDERPVVAVDAGEPGARGAAARSADVALVRAVRPERADRARGELRALAAQAGRDPDRLLVLADLAVDLGGGELGRGPGAGPAPVAGGVGGPLFCGGPVDLAELIAQWHGSGVVDGFHIRPAAPARDLERFVNGTVALLQHRGLFRTFHPGTTLREHLGLHRPPREPAAPAGTAMGPNTRPDAYGRLGS